MGKLIRINGVTFDEKYILKTIEIPDEPVVPDVPDVPDEPVVPVTIGGYPVKDGLKGLYDLGGTAEATLVNHAPEPHVNTAAEKLEGAYVVEDNYVTFSGAGNACRMSTYLRLPLGDGLTYVALFKYVAPNGSAAQRPIIGNFNSSGTPTGVSIGNHIVRYGSNSITTDDYFETSVQSDKFAILAMTFDANGYRVVRYSDGKVIEWPTGKENTPISAWSNNAIQIGGESSSVAYATAAISLAAVHTGKLNDDQLESICKFVYDYGTKTKGLTIE